ncbi:hypothetical protein ABZZ80_04940 [Streptomyces sp. NPDC006356]
MRTRLARLGAVLAAVIALIAAPAVTAAPAQAATQAADQWNPPADLVQPLGEVWNHVESTYPDLYGFRNYGWDQVMANRGSVNYCVRWESDAPVSVALREGGAGGDWGQRVGQEYFTSALGQENIHIYLHEVGHTFGLDDFYDWSPTGQCCFLMKAGSAAQITEFDKWMFRDFWRHLKSRYGL